MPQLFADRRAAGRALATLIKHSVPIQADALVLGLPRGGVPVADEVAAAISAELDILVVRKLGSPGYEELAMGAIAGAGIRVLNDDVIAIRNISAAEIETVARKEGAELERRQCAYRGDRPLPTLTGRQVFLVDDGLATGATMRAAIAFARAQRPAEIIVAVPVAAADTARELRQTVDRLICVEEPAMFMAIGQFYSDFGQTSDEEVIALLQRAGRRQAS
jgi:predicted phosphoribosyltransferase